MTDEPYDETIWLTAEDSRLTWHNVAELRPLGGGERLQRVPDAWRRRFPNEAAGRAVQSANCYVRFQSDSPRVALRWRNAYILQKGMKAFPGEVFRDGERVGEFPMRQEQECVFDSPGGGLWEIHFNWLSAVILKGIGLAPGCSLAPEGNGRKRRWLIYGDSITQGFSASSATGTWVWRAALELGLEPLNLGFAGAALGEAVVAEYIASRMDWDALTLAFGMNGGILGQSSKEVGAAYAEFLRIIRSAHPAKPILCISPVVTKTWDARGQKLPRGESAQAFRDQVAAVVTRAMRTDGNLHFLDGLECLGGVEHLADHVHPNDAGMAHYAQRVARAMRECGAICR